MRKIRLYLVVTAIVILCGASIVGIFRILFGNYDKAIHPGLVQSPSPVAIPHLPFRGKRTAEIVVSSASNKPLNERTESSVTLSAHTYSLWTLSSAKISHVGGGTGGAAPSAAPSSSGHSSQRGIQYGSSGASVVMPITTFVAMASTRQVAAPEAQQAPQLASVGPRRAPGPPDLGGETPPEEHQLIEHPEPIGSPILLVFLAGLYAIARYWRRNRMQNMAN